jgi:hypothetical protein
MTAALLALGAWVAIAPAAPQNGSPSEQDQPFSQRQSNDASQMQGQTSAGQRQIAGEITNLQTVTDPQTGQRRVVAQVRTSGGETIPVDLADPARLRQADLQRGQQITVSGRYGQVNGQRGLIANRLQDEQGYVVQVERVRPQERQQVRQGQPQQQDRQYQEGAGGTQGFQQEGRPQQPSRQAQPSGQQMQQEWHTAHGWQEPPSGQMQQGWQRQPGGQEQSMDDQWQQQAGWEGDPGWQELGWNAQPDQQQRPAQQQRWQPQSSGQPQQEWQQQGQQPSWQTRQQGQARWLQEQGAGGSQGQQQQEGMGRQERMAGLLVTGKMTDTREVQVQGQDQPFLLVKVVTRDGRTVIANLGPRNRLPDNLRLQRGEQVAVTGELGRINNQPVIIAHTFANVVDLEPTWVSLRQQGQRDQQPVQRQQDPQAQQGQREQGTSWQADELDDGN